MTRSVSYKFEVQWDGTNWIDESNYVLSATGDEEIANPEESIFSSNGFVSEANFTLFNKDQRFSPTKSGGALYNHIKDGGYFQKRVRFTVTLGSISHVVFRGFIRGITENARTPTENGAVSLRCTSEDWAIISKKISSPLATTSDFYISFKDEGEIIGKVLELCTLEDGVHFVSQAYAIAHSVTATIDRGMFTIPWFWLDSESPLEDCWRVAAACGGRFYFDTSDGKYYYRNMQYFAFGTSGSSQGTLNESNCLSISPLYNDKELYQRFKITIRPRRIGETTTLWEPEEMIRLFPNETRVITAKFNTPVYEIDNIEKVAVSATGFNESSSVTVTQTENTTQGVKFTIVNSSNYMLFLRTLKIIGRFIEGGETIVYTKDSDDTAFWAFRNSKERSISDNVYIQTYAQAKALCDLLASRQGYTNDKYSVKGYNGTSFFRVGERVTLVNSTVGVNDDAIITSMQWNLGTGNFQQTFTMFSVDHLFPRPVTDYFVIGTHTQQSAKRYFF